MHEGRSCCRRSRGPVKGILNIFHCILKYPESCFRLSWQIFPSILEDIFKVSWTGFVKSTGNIGKTVSRKFLAHLLEQNFSNILKIIPKSPETYFANVLRYSFRIPWNDVTDLQEHFSQICFSHHRKYFLMFMKILSNAFLHYVEYL